MDTGQCLGGRKSIHSVSRDHGELCKNPALFLAPFREPRRSVKVPFHYAGQAPGAPGTYSRIKHMTMDIALKRFASSAKGGQGRKHVEAS